MEGLQTGWVQSSISGTFHFMSHPTNTYGASLSRCGFKSRKVLEYYKKYEILDTSKICIKCEIAIKIISENTKKKRNFIANMEPIKITPDSHVLKPVICSEPRCKESGGSFVSTINPEKEHYCIEHNLRVTETIQKEIEGAFVA